jgi:hypothetical protein
MLLIFNEGVAIASIILYMSVILNVEQNAFSAEELLMCSAEENATLKEFAYFIKLEGWIFTFSLLSIPFFMILKVFVNIRGGMRLTIATKAGNAAFDALDKNFHQFKIIQSYFLNIVVSIYMINYP